MRPISNFGCKVIFVVCRFLASARFQLIVQRKHWSRDLLVQVAYSPNETFTLVCKLDSENIEFYFWGDMKCNMASVSDTNSRFLSHITDVYGLHQLINESTSITNSSSTLIDLTYTIYLPIRQFALVYPMSALLVSFCLSKVDDGLHLFQRAQLYNLQIYQTHSMNIFPRLFPNLQMKLLYQQMGSVVVLNISTQLTRFHFSLTNRNQGFYL